MVNEHEDEPTRPPGNRKPDATGVTAADVADELPDGVDPELERVPTAKGATPDAEPVDLETVDLEETPAHEMQREILSEVVTFFARFVGEEPEEAEPSTARRWLERALDHEEEPVDRTPPTPEFVREQWFDLDYLEAYEIVDRAWVNKPYSYVSVVYDPERKRFGYHVVEPTLTEFESYVRDDLTRVIRNQLLYQDIEEGDDREAVFARRVDRILSEHAATVDPGSVQKLFYYFMRDFVGFGRIDPPMRDPELEDISCDGAEVPLFVYHRQYRDLRTNVSFDSKRLNSLVVRLAQRAGKHISISNPLVDATLPDGSRIQLTLGTAVSSRGSNFTVRKFAAVPYTPVDLVGWNTFGAEQMAYLWLAIENNMSLLFAGGTGSGKTTSMNAVGFFIPPDSKVVSIEDTRELTLPHDNWIQSVTRQGVGSAGQGEVDTLRLLQAALRQRPEYLLVGEMRTEQQVALTFFQAIGTGHTAYSTVHADSPEAALARLENAPLSVPAQMIQNLDIISVQRQVFKDDRRVRRNVTLAEVRSTPDGGVTTEAVFERDPETDSYERTGESTVLDRVASQRGWSKKELEAQLRDRKHVLEYLLEQEITDYQDVAAVIHTFSRDPELVLTGIEERTLDPAALREEQ